MKYMCFIVIGKESVYLSPAHLSENVGCKDAVNSFKNVNSTGRWVTIRMSFFRCLEWVSGSDRPNLKQPMVCLKYSWPPRYFQVNKLREPLLFLIWKRNKEDVNSFVPNIFVPCNFDMFVFILSSLLMLVTSLPKNTVVFCFCFLHTLCV